MLIEQVPFQILYFDHEPWKLRVSLLVEAGIFACDPGKPNAFQCVSDCCSLRRYLGGIARNPCLFHRLLQQIDRVIGLGVRVMRNFLGYKTTLGILLPKVPGKFPGQIISVGPIPGNNQKSVRVLTKEIQRVG
ncbi:MAG: hypothetical protein JWO88_3983, partial [Frankiales bacterium]|nr:hypothetical protein [Frankiales bacterium]